MWCGGRVSSTLDDEMLMVWMPDHQGVWRGSLGGEGGMTKGRLALLNLGLERPDLVDIGLRDWNETR